MLSHSSPVEIPLLQYNDHDTDQKDLDDLEELAVPSKALTRRWQLSRCLPYFSLVFNVVGIFAMVMTYESDIHRVSWRGDSAVYSPARDAIFHKDVTFLGLTDRSVYHGPPTDAVDEAWEALYESAISSIPQDQASRLANKTVEFEDFDNLLIVQLDVFHVLHCLNTLRKAIWSERYPHVRQQRFRNISGIVFDHIDHCVNNIRESIICSADVTPNVWRFNEHPLFGAPRPRAVFNNVHSCVDFDALQAWAKNDHAPLKFSDDHNTHGDLVLEADDRLGSENGAEGSEHHNHADATI